MAQALTYCRKSCGNNMHVKCMKMYAEFQRSSTGTKVRGPFVFLYNPYIVEEDRDAAGVKQFHVSRLLSKVSISTSRKYGLSKSASQPPSGFLWCAGGMSAVPCGLGWARERRSLPLP